MSRLLVALLLTAVYANLHAQSCPEPTYHKTYRIDNANVETDNDDAVVIPGDILYSAGETLITGSNGIVYGYGMLAKYDNTGALLWQKAYSTGNESTDSWTGFNQVIATADNGLLLTGLASVSFYESNPTFTKTDLDGNPIWTEIFPEFETYAVLQMRTAALPDGGFAYNFGPMMVGRIDKNGTPVWTKSFQYANSAPASNAKGNIIYGDGALYVGFSITEQNQRTHMHLLKLDPDNGSVIWEKEVNDPNFTISIDQLIVRNNMLYIPYELDSTFALFFRTSGRIRLDENGNVQDIAHFVVPFASPISMIFSKNDPFVASVYYAQPGKIGLINVPSEGYVKWAHDYNTPSYTSTVMSIADLSSGGYLAITDYGLSTDYGGSTWLTRVNSAGQMPGCTTTNAAHVGIQHITLPFTPDNLQSSDITPQIQSYNLSTTSQNPVEATVCSGQDVCSSLTLDPHSNICALGDTVTFTANQGSGCTLAVNWNYDASAATIVSASPASVSLSFQKSGAFQLTGTLQTSCQLLQNTISIQVYNSPDGVNLGPDRVLCTGILDTLHAGSGFQTYQWQDGSTDSLYQVSSAGNYSVTVTNYCNEQFTDAIQLSAPSAVSFDLGPAITICPGDTTTVNPPAGFTNYTWAPTYHELTSALPSLSVYPDQDTTYTCTALTTQGCPVADSIRIRLAQSQPIDLGKLVTICPDGQTTLDAGSGFTSYRWSTGETTQQITVDEPARYAVRAVNTDNCISRDTITVSLYTVSQPTLGADIYLCTDSTHVLNAGNNFVSYLWQDGSTKSTFVVTQPDVYWARVTDSNGCSAEDTVDVIGKTNCQLGIYFPNAFTPNGDGKNDTFKPILFGSLDVYRLTILNRWGEIVFESNNPDKGWDGRYNNKSNSTNTFVWYATYHFSGNPGPPIILKGTLLLIK